MRAGDAEGRTRVRAVRQPNDQARPAVSPEQPFRMRTRIVSALVGAPLVIGAVLWPGGAAPFPGWPFAVFVLALVLVGLREFYDGCRAAGYHPRDSYGMAAGVLLVLAAVPLPLREAGSTIIAALTLLLLVSLVVEALRPHRAPLRSLPASWLGALYVGWLFSFALRLRLADEEAISALGWRVPNAWMHTAGEGALLVLYTMLVTSAVDTGAYFAGKALGRHKLAPEVSPGKTWEGSVGGFLAGVLLAAVLGAWLRLPLAFSLTAGSLIGVVAQLGDLSKSAIKREIGIKDFGALIPGHGGVLDRFDSLLFTAPTVYWLIRFWPGAP